jgi:hypothetical protein
VGIRSGIAAGEKQAVLKVFKVANCDLEQKYSGRVNFWFGNQPLCGWLISGVPCGTKLWEHEGGKRIHTLDGQRLSKHDIFTTMNALDEVKAAAAKLRPDEQVEFFRWWVESDEFKQRQLAALKRDLAVGLDQLKDGNYKEFDDGNVMELAEGIGRRGRKRFKGKG